MSIGFHYTSLENWWHIQNEGLIPYSINKPDLKEPFPDGIAGIWLWDNDLYGDEHIGSVLWQVMARPTLIVVKLCVYYEKNDLLYYGGKPVEILHDGKLGSWTYHTRVPAVVVTNSISKENIARVETYDLREKFRCTY